jgi:hypothetical protein
MISLKVKRVNNSMISKKFLLQAVLVRTSRQAKDEIKKSIAMGVYRVPLKGCERVGKCAAARWSVEQI